MNKPFGQKIISTLLIALFVSGVSITNAVASNESDAAKIKRAMKAAPRNISEDATIMDADGTILREGSNGWTCFPGVPLIPGDKHPMCNDAVWMDWLYDLFNESPPSPPLTIGISYMLLGDALVSNSDPGATDPNEGGPWIQEGPHIMMLFPNLDDIANLPRDPHAGGPYVMWADTPLVHVMVPVTKN